MLSISLRAASSVHCLCIPISRALILKILFSSPPGSRVCCRRLVPDSCSIARRPDVRTYPDLMMEGTRSQHPTSVDSLPLYHRETETVALKEVLNLAVFCEFPSLFPSPPGGTSVAMPQLNLKYTCSASLRIFLNSRAHKLQKCVKLQFRRNAEVRCFAQSVFSQSVSLSSISCRSATISV